MTDDKYDDSFDNWWAVMFRVIVFVSRLVLTPIFSLIFAVPLYFMWNYVMPDFGLPHLTYLKMVCLLIIFDWLFPIKYIATGRVRNEICDYS